MENNALCLLLRSACRCQYCEKQLKNKRPNLMSLAILFHFLCAKHVSDINMSIIRSLRLCY